MSVYQLVFYVPESHIELVKEAVFSAGAGKIGDYDRCCWQVLGEGQFRPLSGSTPFIGKKGQEQRLAEYRVEMVLAKQNVSPVIEALKKAHPYEEPAFSVWLLANTEQAINDDNARREKE